LACVEGVVHFLLRVARSPLHGDGGRGQKGGQFYGRRPTKNSEGCVRDSCWPKTGKIVWSTVSQPEILQSELAAGQLVVYKIWAGPEKLS